jgi:hypothetical protein
VSWSLTIKGNPHLLIHRHEWQSDFGLLQGFH